MKKEDGWNVILNRKMWWAIEFLVIEIGYLYQMKYFMGRHICQRTILKRLYIFQHHRRALILNIMLLKKDK